MKKTISLLLALGLALALAACGGIAPGSAPQSPSDSSQVPGTSAGSHYPVTITNYDYAGNPVEYTYRKAPERVICVYQGCIETMIALGLEDHVLASYGLDNEVKDEWKDGFGRMNYDSSVFAPDKETVTLLEPDMIFSGKVAGVYQMGTPAIEPEKVVVSGPVEQVNQVDKVVAILKTEELSERFAGDLPLTPLDKQGKPLTDLELTFSAETAYVVVPVVMMKEVPLTVNLLPGGGATGDDAVWGIDPRTIVVSGSEAIKS